MFCVSHDFPKIYFSASLEWKISKHVYVRCLLKIMLIHFCRYSPIRRHCSAIYQMNIKNIYRFLIDRNLTNFAFTVFIELYIYAQLLHSITRKRTMVNCGFLFIVFCNFKMTSNLEKPLFIFKIK